MGVYLLFNVCQCISMHAHAFLNFLFFYSFTYLSSLILSPDRGTASVPLIGHFQVIDFDKIGNSNSDPFFSFFPRYWFIWDRV